ncbi:MAG: hypothetical protein ACLP9L_02620 [Thermoguttaceae bacterium]
MKPTEILKGSWRHFENVEHEHMGLGTHQKFLNVAEELADRFGVTQTVGKSSRGCGCHRFSSDLL